ncbi:MAG: YceI family protein [Cyclobacteriaceae bacterium]|nr:YceI family protein [Cyclobacteriaceae bacterium]
MRNALLIIFCIQSYWGVAQKYIADKGTVSFFSHAAIEDIAAENKKVGSIFNSITHELVFSIPISEFRFPKALMQEHFNEKYLESDKYPTSTFQGKLIGYDPLVEKQQSVTANGQLTIHGVTRKVEVPGTIERSGEKLILKSKFSVTLENYRITIPKLLWQNIAEQVEVSVLVSYKAQ